MLFRSKSRVFYDSSTFVGSTIDEVVKTLGIAFVLVVVVVFLFLGNFRATLIPVVAIPVSLIGTFAVLPDAMIATKGGSTAVSKVIPIKSDSGTTYYIMVSTNP